jgi:hypothetical protein
MTGKTNLSTAEKKLPVTERELLATVFGTKQLRSHFYNRKFTLAMNQ